MNELSLNFPRHPIQTHIYISNVRKRVLDVRRLFSVSLLARQGNVPDEGQKISSERIAVMPPVMNFSAEQEPPDDQPPPDDQHPVDNPNPVDNSNPADNSGSANNPNPAGDPDSAYNEKSRSLVHPGSSAERAQGQESCTSTPTEHKKDTKSGVIEGGDR